MTGALTIKAPAVPAGSGEASRSSGRPASASSAPWTVAGSAPRLDAGLDESAGRRVLHGRGGIDGPAPDQARERRQRWFGEVLVQRHLGLKVLQGHPVRAGDVQQRRRQRADLSSVGHHRDQVLRKSASSAGGEAGLGIGQTPVAGRAVAIGARVGLDRGWESHAAGRVLRALVRVIATSARNSVVRVVVVRYAQASAISSRTFVAAWHSA